MLKKIDSEAFAHSFMNEIELPDTLEYIGGDCFSNCYFLQHLTIPESVEYIGNDAFGSCYNLEYVAFSNRSFSEIEDIPTAYGDYSLWGLEDYQVREGV